MNSLHPQLYSRIVVWQASDCARILPVPPGHQLEIRHGFAFKAFLEFSDGHGTASVDSRCVNTGHTASFEFPSHPGDAVLLVQPSDGYTLRGWIRFLTGSAQMEPVVPADGLVLLTNGRGGMARICVDLGSIKSRYDCVLGANLHSSVPT